MIHVLSSVVVYGDQKNFSWKLLYLQVYSDVSVHENKFLRCVLYDNVVETRCLLNTRKNDVPFL